MSREAATGEGLPAAAVSSRATAGHRLLHAGEAWALVAVTGVMVVFFSLYPETSDTFPTLANFKLLAGSQAIPMLLALAVLVPLVCGEIDLSVGAALGLSSVLAAYGLGHGVPLAAAVPIGLAAGALVGGINGTLVARAGVSGVIATLGSALVIAGAVLAITDGRSLHRGVPDSLSDFATRAIGGVPRIFIAAAAVTALVYYLLAHTPVGRRLAMLGANRRAAVLVGLRPSRLLTTSFVVSGALSGLAGVLLLGRSGLAAPEAGPPLTFPALTAAFLSAAAIRTGHYNVGGVVAAIAFLAVLNNGLNGAGAPPWVSEVVNGVALVAGAALAAYLGRRRRDSG
jgi:ribose transport system permease protein